MIIGLHNFVTHLFIRINSDLLWNHTWQSAQWQSLNAMGTEVNLSVFVYKVFHEDFSPFVRTIIDDFSTIVYTNVGRFW